MKQSATAFGRRLVGPHATSPRGAAFVVLVLALALVRSAEAGAPPEPTWYALLEGSGAAAHARIRVRLAHVVGQTVYTLIKANERSSTGRTVEVLPTSDEYWATTSLGMRRLKPPARAPTRVRGVAACEGSAPWSLASHAAKGRLTRADSGDLLVVHGSAVASATTWHAARAAHPSTLPACVAARFSPGTAWLELGSQRLLAAMHGEWLEGLVDLTGGTCHPLTAASVCRGGQGDKGASVFCEIDTQFLAPRGLLEVRGPGDGRTGERWLIVAVGYSEAQGLSALPLSGQGAPDVDRVESTHIVCD